MPTLEFDQQFKGIVAGIDEVGRGPWAGPVVASIAVFENMNLTDFLLENVKDSKLLSKPRREKVFTELKNLQGFHCGIGIASVDDIDSLNILQATFLAMKRALDDLAVSPQVLLIDGKTVPRFEGYQIHPVVKGDSKSYSIAAASIIAKVTRDTLMESLALEYPGFGWEKNAGYGTAEHQKALSENGVTPHHRNSFAPIRALLAQHG